MPTIANVNCSNCNSSFDITLKYFNECKKHNWNWFCSRACFSEFRKTGSLLVCANPKCLKQFYRQHKNINDDLKNYCSSRCSALVNNPRRKKFTLCQNSKCGKMIPFRNKYCSSRCWGTRLKEINREKQRERVLTEIKRFVYLSGRIPVKRELGSICMLARKVFGTWNKAIEVAGYETNPVLFSKRHTAKDGHRCDSLAEMIIDDWLYKNGIDHKIHVPYPGQKRLTADFLIDRVWVEFFGIYGVSKKYTASADRKIKLARKHSLDLIKVFPADIFPTNKMKTLLFATNPVRENTVESL